MYEVELKVELTKDEKKSLVKTFEERGFEFRKTTPQKDYYIEAKKSPYYEQGGSYDLKRYRDEDNKLIYTAKTWEMVNGNLARQEEEFEVSRDKFDEEIQKYQEAIKIEKVRDWYLGEYRGEKISLTVDTVDFDHSPETRYFMEAEIDVDDKNKTKSTKDLINDFLKDILGKDEVIEAPGMFKMAFEKE